MNLDGVFLLSHALIPHMRERRQGSIACMSFVSARRGGIFGGPHYGAKAGMLGLAKAMARVYLFLAGNLSSYVAGGMLIH